MAYRIARFPTTLHDLEGHAPIASHFKFHFLYSCVAVDKISTEITRLAGPFAVA